MVRLNKALQIGPNRPYWQDERLGKDPEKSSGRTGPWVGAGGTLPENIAWAVAKGIALGCNEGLALAAKATAEAEKDA